MINSQIGGTSGAIYSLLFTAAHNFIHNHYFIQSNNDDSKKQPSGKKIIEKFWLKLIEYCMERLSCYGGARINDRSMIGKYSKNQKKNQNFQINQKFINS